MKSKAFLKATFFAIGFCCLSVLAIAEKGPGDSGPDPDPDPIPSDTEIPVDLGLSLFVAAGVGYAIKRRADNKKKAANK